jgi:hypothetical protein
LLAPLYVRPVEVPVTVGITAFVDLSFHVVNVEFRAGAVPVALGSVPSSQNCRPDTSVGVKFIPEN